MLPRVHVVGPHWSDSDSHGEERWGEVVDHLEGEELEGDATQAPNVRGRDKRAAGGGSISRKRQKIIQAWRHRLPSAVKLG